MTQSEAFALLGVAPGSAPEVIRSAYEQRRQSAAAGGNEALLDALQEARTLLLWGGQEARPPSSLLPDNRIDQVMSLVRLYYTPREGQRSESQLRDKLEQLLQEPIPPPPPREKQQSIPPVPPMSRSVVEFERAGAAIFGSTVEHPSISRHVLESESDSGLFTTIGEAIYAFVLWLPFVLIVMTLLVLGMHRLVWGSIDLWSRWLLAAGATTVGLFLCCLLLAWLRRRIFPPRWQLIEDEDGVALEARRLLGQAGCAREGECEMLTSWLGRLFGMDRVLIGEDRKSFLAPGIAQANLPDRFISAQASDKGRSIREGFAAAISLLGGVFVLLRTYSEPVQRTFRPDDRVLLLLVLAAAGYLAVGWIVGWLADQREPAS